MLGGVGGMLTRIVMVLKEDVFDAMYMQVTYSIGNSTPAADRDVFSINNQTGVISVAAPLNFESRSQYNLIVMATDNAPVDTRRNASVNVR